MIYFLNAGKYEIRGPKLAEITSKITSIEQAITSVKNTDIDTGTPLELTNLAGKETAGSTKNARDARVSATTNTREQNNQPKPNHDLAHHNNGENFGWIRNVTMIALIFWFCIAAILCFSVMDISNNATNYSGLQWAGIAGLFLGPALMIWVAGYSMKQLARITGHAQELKMAVNSLTQPDQTVIRKSKSMATAIAIQVDDVNDKLNTALGRLATMEDVLNAQTSSLAQSNTDATQTTEKIAVVLQSQTEALDAISGTFDGRMQALSQTISVHTDKLAQATQLAEQKIKEARISVEGATSKINSASDIVRANTLQAASTLSASHADINSLGDVIRERSVELDTVYKKHANDLTAMIEHLRDEQQNLGAVLEERLTKMRDLSLSAQASAESLIEASAAGKDTVEALAQSASLADTAVKARFAEMKDMVRYSNEHAQKISDKAAQRVKDSLELTRMEISRIEHDMSDLQNRIGSVNQKSLELVPDPTPETDLPTAQKKRWTRLKLKPVQDDEPVIAFSQKPDGIDNTDSQVEETPSIFDDNIEATTTEPNPTLDTYFEPSHDKNTPDIPVFLNTDTDTGHIETIQRTAPHEGKGRKKPGFTLRNIFGKRGDKNQDDSFSIVTQPTPIEESTIPHDEAVATSIANPDDIIQALGQLGLAPNAVVDDGCIIEAANSRTSMGHEAMSRVVTHRLKGPVEHLVKALTVDPQLSQTAIEFASEFDKSIEAISGNREAIRTRLESELGRSYLLCDAALNHGRV